MSLRHLVTQRHSGVPASSVDHAEHVAVRAAAECTLIGYDCSAAGQQKKLRINTNGLTLFLVLFLPLTSSNPRHVLLRLHDCRLNESPVSVSPCGGPQQGRIWACAVGHARWAR